MADHGQLVQPNGHCCLKHELLERKRALSRDLDAARAVPWRTCLGEGWGEGAFAIAHQFE